MRLCVMTIVYGISNAWTATYVLQNYQYRPFSGPVSKHRHPNSGTSLIWNYFT